jgi:multiple sugar transport system permease protein
MAIRTAPPTRSKPPWTVRARHAVAAGPRMAVLLVVAAFFAVPVVWLLLAVTKTDSQIVRDAPFSFGSLGNVRATWDRLWDFQDHAMRRWLVNSAFYSLGSVALTLLASVPAGYALAMTRFRGRRLLLTLTLVVMLMPAASLVLPLFLELNAAGLVGSPLSVILPMSFFPFGVYLTFIYFTTGLPQELLHAARLDGCSEWQVFRFVALPLARPVVALVGFFAFVGNWNNFFLPFVMLPDSQDYPVQVGLQYLLSSTPAFNPASGGGGLDIFRPELALAVVLAIVPVLLVFLFAQRSLVSGMLAGSSKE